MTIDTDTRILIVGFGNMGRALVRGWLDAGIKPATISVADQQEQARTEAASWGLRIVDDTANEQDAGVDVLVLAVKPQQVDAALSGFEQLIADNGVIVSIAAGRTIESLQQHTPDTRAIVRSMPNLPAAIACGTTVLYANDVVSDDQRKLCAGLLSAVGAVFWIDHETMFDAVTAISGSGPAYVFLLTECLTAAGVRQGLPERLAAALARHTVAGAGAYALDSQTSVSVLREQVTSPGGTTAAALSIFMEDDALEQLVDEAVAAAAARSAELSRE